MTDWASAACRHADPSLFEIDAQYSENRSARNQRLKTVTRTYCHGCLIQGACLQDLIESRDHGVLRAGHYRRTPDGVVRDAATLAGVKRNRKAVTDTIRELAGQGYSDMRIAHVLNIGASSVGSHRRRHRIPAGAVARKGAA